MNWQSCLLIICSFSFNDIKALLNWEMSKNNRPSCLNTLYQVSIKSKLIIILKKRLGILVIKIFWKPILSWLSNRTTKCIRKFTIKGTSCAVTLVGTVFGTYSDVCWIVRFEAETSKIIFHKKIRGNIW